jgi:hypothetical protein
LLSAGLVDLICIQFPDPHFKRRNYKRRIFQPAMVADVVRLLPPGGRLLLQSDVLGVAVAMRNMFEKYGGRDVLVPAAQHTEAPGAVFIEEPPAARSGQAANGCSSGSESDGRGAPTPAPTPASATPVPQLPLRPAQASVSAVAGIPSRDCGSDDGEGGAGDSGSECDVGPGDEDDYLTMSSEWAKAGWLKKNPLGTPTEREHYVMQQGLPVYRILLRKVECGDT